MSESTDYDGAWKEALELYLEPFLQLCFPTVAQGIDWALPVEFLDQELQEIVRDADLGKQRVDKLVKVRRRDGAEEWVLLHVEIQAQPDDRLPLRVYQYHHRIADRFGRRVATLVVLADLQAEWTPTSYHEELWGCRVRFEYPICKLLDFVRDRAALEASDNPAAIVVAAHLAAQATHRDMDQRHRLKWQLTRRLYERDFDRKNILELFRLIDWLMALPDELAVAFRGELINFETEKRMPYVTSIERLGRQEGRQEGRQQGRQEALRDNILDVLETRFGALPPTMRHQVETAQDEGQLKRLLRQAAVAQSLAAFESAL
ncbi:MAG: transposase [Verrucomicrobia bacterium]|nr:transposase [Verrucomicrobiota bacterium]